MGGNTRYVSLDPLQNASVEGYPLQVFGIIVRFGIHGWSERTSTCQPTGSNGSARQLLGQVGSVADRIAYLKLDSDW